MMAETILERHTADEVRDAVETALAEGRTDGLEGGVATETIAEIVGIEDSTVSTYLRALVEVGELERVRGLSPDGVVRSSVLPADHPHAGGGSGGYSGQEFTGSGGETA